MNWTDLWYQPRSRIGPGKLCERISRLFLRGVVSERAVAVSPALARERSGAS